MPSTFLDLTNKLLRRINETELTSSNFSSARGIHATAKDAIYDTVNEINQQEQVWPFNTASGSQVLTVGQEEYTWPASFLVPDWESFYVERSVSLNISTKPLVLINRETWMANHRPFDFDSTTDGRAVPDYIFPSDTGFGVSPSPDQAYTVKFTYYTPPGTLSAHGDTVTIPSNWDYVIILGALSHMNLFKENPQGQQIADERYKRVLGHMRGVLINKFNKMESTVVNFGGQPWETSGTGYF